jgi:hypothetical protein
MDPDPGGPKIYGYNGSGFGSGSATLKKLYQKTAEVLQLWRGRWRLEQRRNWHLCGSHPEEIPNIELFCFVF